MSLFGLYDKWTFFIVRQGITIALPGHACLALKWNTITLPQGLLWLHFPIMLMATLLALHWTSSASSKSPSHWRNSAGITNCRIASVNFLDQEVSPKLLIQVFIFFSRKYEKNWSLLGNLQCKLTNFWEDPEAFELLRDLCEMPLSNLLNTTKNQFGAY